MSGHRTARTLIYTHRWLGIAGGLLFVVWFASGIVMMYAQMPSLDPAERAARLAPLDLSSLRIGPDRVAGASGAGRLGLAMLNGRPVYRLFDGRRWSTMFADSGDWLDGLTRDAAIETAGRFAPEHAGTIRHDRRLTDADQWTFGVRGLMPVHRVALGDPDDTRVYVSEQTGDVVMKTTATGRRWGYLGAVLHWLYFTPFRRQASLWSETIIWLSIAGAVLALTGLAWGLWRVSASQRYRLRLEPSRSPYAGLMRWHHYVGLIFGLTTFTWVFSGLLSMDPWSWSPGTSATRAQREAIAGGPLALHQITAEELREAASAFGSPSPAEVDVVQFRASVYLHADRGLVSIKAPERGLIGSFDRDDLLAAAEAAVPGASVADTAWLTEYDANYYDRGRGLSLPVLRVRYADRQGTWLYLDPARGTIVRKEERLSRVNRWLYHGFHSLDFPFLYYRRPLWDIVVITLSLGGIVLSVTTMAAAWHRLRRHAQRLTPPSSRTS